jgi:predicted nucleotidyltransferase
VTDSELHQVLEEAAKRLRDALQPTAIYFFGSHAYGEPTRDSDIDLLVIVPHSPLPFHQRATAAYRALRGLGVPVDVQVYTHAEFEERSNLPVSFERTVRTRGRLLYAA